MSSDVSEADLTEAMPGRPVRAYPALLSTEAEATAWARAGASAGSVVVAGYQVSPRGRGGTPWQVRLGQGLGFSLVMRPDLTAEREGWPYVVASLGISDALGGHATTLHWPDEVTHANGDRLAALGLTVQLGPQRTDWAVATVLVEAALPPRAPLLAAVTAAIERRAAQPPAGVIEDYRSRCATLGQKVLARMIPLGPAGPQVAGTAVDVLDDGALVLLTERENRVAVRPQNLGLLEPAEQRNGVHEL
ncbi:MAG: hypothetical protein M3393_10820 [Actinomycetota bacterium]|nr:hypothetical protein [Actinomycetota bacterium]